MADEAIDPSKEDCFVVPHSGTPRNDDDCDCHPFLCVRITPPIVIAPPMMKTAVTG